MVKMELSWAQEGVVGLEYIYQLFGNGMREFTSQEEGFSLKYDNEISRNIMLTPISSWELNNPITHVFEPKSYQILNPPVNPPI
jgi:hypothetical protein